VLHNKQPFKNRIRYAPEVASRPDILEKDLERARVLLVRLEAEYYSLRKVRVLSREEVAALPEGPLQEETLTLAEGEEYRDDPEPSKSTFAAIEQRIEKVYAEAAQEGLDEDDLKIRKVRPLRILRAPSATESISKITMSLDLVLAALRNAFHTCYYCAVTTDHQEELQRKCIQHLRKPISKATYDEYKAKMAENSVKIKEEPPMQEDGDLKPKEEQSPDDRVREASTKEDDSREWKKSGTFSPVSRLSLSTDQEQKIAGSSGWILNSQYCLIGTLSTLVLMGGRVMTSELFVICPTLLCDSNPISRELAKVAEPFVKQEDEGKFRCKTCQKLFKATSFVEKHIANKHSELVKPLDDVSALGVEYRSLLTYFSSCRTSIILLSTLITSSHTVIYRKLVVLVNKRHLRPTVYQDLLRCLPPTTCGGLMGGCSTHHRTLQVAFLLP
jgi:hypothetical protein